MVNMTDINKVVEIGRQLQECEIQWNRLLWVQFTTGFDCGVNEAYEKVTHILKNRKYYDTILEHKEKQLDPLDKRRVDIIANAFEPYHISEEVNQLNLEMNKKTTQLAHLLNTYRYTLRDREVRSTEIEQILLNEPDRKLREKAFLARSQINQILIENGFLDLINMRKDYARLCGSTNFVEYRLKFDELTSSLFKNWISETHDIFCQIKDIEAEYGKKFLNDTNIMPWDTAYIGTRLIPQLNKQVDMSQYLDVLRNAFLRLGFDITKFNITYDIFPRKHKSEWGYNFAIQAGRDSRILANVENRYSQYAALLHETGHAIHSLYLNPEDTLLNKGISNITRETVAFICSDLLYYKEFYSCFFKDSIPEVEKAFANSKKWNKLNCMAMMHTMFFDQALYLENLNFLDDVNELYWKKYKSIIEKESYTDNPPWGFKIHHTMTPVYLHSYFLGDVFRHMLYHHFKKTHGISKVMEKPLEFGRFLLNEIIKPSGTYPFIKLFEKISGEPFSLKYLSD